jgi:hypothetical protein
MIINTNSHNGLTKQSAISLLITLNVLFVISFTILCFLFTKDSFNGSFWDWCWDSKYFLEDPKTNAGLGSFFLWIPMFCANGIGALIFLWSTIDSFIYGKR